MNRALISSEVPLCDTCAVRAEVHVAFLARQEARFVFAWRRTWRQHQQL